MRKFHRAIVVSMVVLALGATSVAVMAATPYDTPAEAVAGITGRTEEEVREERIDTGLTYGEIAIEAGRQEDFQAAMIDMRQAALTTKVEEGTLTQEEADAILAQISACQSDCDGTRAGQQNRENLGLFVQNGQGEGDGQRNGANDGAGQGEQRNGANDGAGQGGQRHGASDDTGMGQRDGSSNAG